MRKLFLVFTLLFAIASFGQEAKGFYMKNKNATIYFRDSTTLDGLAKITSFNDIKFRKNKKSKKITYNSKLVYKLIIHKKDIDIEYHYKIVFERPNPILLEIAVKGRLSLYRELQVYTYNSGSPVLYVTKDDSDFADIIGYTKSGSKSKKNIKELLSYIEDCPNLVDLIQNGKFKHKSIEEIIKYYNLHCVEKKIEEQKTESTNTEIKD